MNPSSQPFELHDRTLLRELASQVAEIAARPEMHARRAALGGAQQPALQQSR